MVASKRRGEDTPSTRKLKKAKLSEEKGKRGDALALAQSNPDEVDFPRGGGTTLSALEVKAIQREGVKEADQELFKVSAYSWSITLGFKCCFTGKPSAIEKVENEETQRDRRYRCIGRGCE